MAKQTLQARIVAALSAAGEREVNGTFRYRKFTREPIDGKVTFYYVGKKGAVRYGSTIASSVPVSRIFYKKLLGEYP